MLDCSIEKRTWVAVGVLVAGLVLVRSVSSEGLATSLARPLRDLPSVLTQWRGEDVPLPGRIVEVAGVDDYLNRSYADAAGNGVALYVGYYGGQRIGDSIHSPKNCLPGAGWAPARSGLLAIPLAGGSAITVNEYIVEKGLDRELVLYWYQGRGRVVASEYAGKFWQVVDSIARRRTDGALVRIVTPTRDGEEKAQARAITFVQALYPRLQEFFSK